MDAPLSIAIADDEPDMRQYFELILPRLGHKVSIAAENGQQLRNHCRRNPVDLIITDLKMPIMDGLTAALDINQHVRTPVIVVTGNHDESLTENMKTWMLGFLRKPIKMNDLASAISRAESRLVRERN